MDCYCYYSFICESCLPPNSSNNINIAQESYEFGHMQSSYDVDHVQAPYSVDDFSPPNYQQFFNPYGTWVSPYGGPTNTADYDGHDLNQTINQLGNLSVVPEYAAAGPSSQPPLSPTHYTTSSITLHRLGDPSAPDNPHPQHEPALPPQFCDFCPHYARTNLLNFTPRELKVHLHDAHNQHKHHFCCPARGCDRARQPFSRDDNLIQHLKQVHEWKMCRTKRSTLTETVRKVYKKQRQRYAEATGAGIRKKGKKVCK